MLRLIVLLVLFVSYPGIACSRLGESIQETEARYGAPIKDPHNATSPLLKNAENKTYDYQGWRIRVAFLNGYAVRIAYSKAPRAGSSPSILDDEALAILKGEAHGGTWKKLKAGSVLFGANTGNKVFDGFKSIFQGKPTGNRNFDTAPRRWANTKNLIAYIPAGSLRMVVEAPEALMWENAIMQGKEEKRKEGIPKF